MIRSKIDNYSVFELRHNRYAGIGGVSSYVQRSMEFAYGADNPALKEGRIAAVQSISGTGGCRVGGELLAKFFPSKTIHIPNPTWGNHPAVFARCGLTSTKYRYYDHANRCLDFKGLVEDITKAEDGSTFLLHSCAHNPTGCDPSRAQWDELSQLMLKKNHIVFFDNAYQVWCSLSN